MKNMCNARFYLQWCYYGGLPDQGVEDIASPFCACLYPLNTSGVFLFLYLYLQYLCSNTNAVIKMTVIRICYILC